MWSGCKSLRWNYIVLLLGFLLGTKPRLQAQGLCFNAAEMKTKKFTYTEKCKLHLHEWPYKDYVTVLCNKTKKRLSKDSLYAYRDAQGTLYRFFEKEIYEIVNPNEDLLLYKRSVLSANAKNAEGEEVFYFSVTDASPPIKLSLYNLEKAFAANSLFCAYLELHFKDDSALNEYDHEHKTYKLNRLYQLSKNKTQ